MKSKFNWKSVQNLISSVVQTLAMPKAWKLFKAVNLSESKIRVEKDWNEEEGPGNWIFNSFSIVFSILQYKHQIGFVEKSASEISTSQKTYKKDSF